MEVYRKGKRVANVNDRKKHVRVEGGKRALKCCQTDLIVCVDMAGG